MSVSTKQYFNRLMSTLGGETIPLTEKLKESLIRSARIARSQKVHADDDSLMSGLIEARSAVIPILDSAGVDIRKYAKLLMTDLSGYDYVEENSFVSDYELLADQESRNHVQAYRILMLARTMANLRERNVIDTSLFLEALFRQSLFGKLHFDNDDLETLAQQPLNQQIIHLLTSAPEGEETFEISNSLEETIETLADRDLYLGSVFEKITPYIRDVGSLARMEDTIRFTRNVEPYIESTRLLLVPGRNQIHLRQFDYLNSYLYTEQREPAICKINTFSGGGFISWEDIETFEHLINQSNVTEFDLQKFFETHPAFLQGSDYCRLHSQVVLVNDSGDELIPDFFAERIGTIFSDIIELKKPSARLVSGKKNRRGFSSALTQALNQIREYRNYFDNPARRKHFHKLYGFEAFRPAVTVVIGRSSDYLSHIERIQIEDEYKNLRIMTYDDILQRAKRLTITK